MMKALLLALTIASAAVAFPTTDGAAAARRGLFAAGVKRTQKGLSDQTCQPGHGPTGKENNDCCTKTHPCPLGGGDCDHDNECQGPLRCGKDNCKFKVRERAAHNVVLFSTDSAPTAII